MDTETLIIVVAIALWFAHGWYLNERLKFVHRKLDRVLDQFNGLRRYLYEIDPQFDDERQLQKEALEGAGLFAGLEYLKLRKEKEESGRRTLNSPFVEY